VRKSSTEEENNKGFIMQGFLQRIKKREIPLKWISLLNFVNIEELRICGG
jgi:hypothetical protein